MFDFGLSRGPDGTLAACSLRPGPDCVRGWSQPQPAGDPGVLIRPSPYIDLFSAVTRRVPAPSSSRQPLLSSLLCQTCFPKAVLPGTGVVEQKEHSSREWRGGWGSNLQLSLSPGQYWASLNHGT